MSIGENLHRVRERMARAAELAGRNAAEITLVGVSKYVGPREAAELAAAGCSDLGESRPQELWKKADALIGTRAERFKPSDSPIRWHLIGHLQRNKVARTLPLVTLIHSVDSLRLLAAINEAARNEAALTPAGEARREPRPPINVLLEVNTSDESAKTGLAPAEVEPLLNAAPNYPHVAIRGLMTMAALDGGQEVAAHNFASLRELRDRLKANSPDCVRLHELSMGMSDDFEVAIQEGATIVRIGSLLWKSKTKEH